MGEPVLKPLFLIGTIVADKSPVAAVKPPGNAVMATDNALETALQI